MPISPVYTWGVSCNARSVLSVLSATWTRSPSSSQKPLISLIQLHLRMYAARAWVVLSQCSRSSPVHCCPSHCTEYATQSNVVSRDQLVRLGAPNRIDRLRAALPQSVAVLACAFLCTTVPWVSAAQVPALDQDS